MYSLNKFSTELLLAGCCEASCWEGGAPDCAVGGADVGVAPDCALGGCVAPGCAGGE